MVDVVVEALVESFVCPFRSTIRLRVVHRGHPEVGIHEFVKGQPEF